MTIEQERILREAAAQDGSEDDLSGWIREAALTKATGGEIADPIDTTFVERIRRIIATDEVRLRDIPQPITLVFFEQTGRSGVWWDQSHFIHTPVQTAPYTTSLPRGDTLEHARRRALATFTSFYDMASQEGFNAEADWLVPNEKFRQT